MRKLYKITAEDYRGDITWNAQQSCWEDNEQCYFDKISDAEKELKYALDDDDCADEDFSGGCIRMEQFKDNELTRAIDREELFIYSDK